MEILSEKLEWVTTHLFCAPTTASVTIYLLYYAYICLASILLPAKIVDGHPHPKRGPRLKYSINGFRLTCLTIFICTVLGGMCPYLKSVQLFNISIIADEFWPLWSTVNIVAFIVSTLLYLKGTLGKSFFG